MHAERYTVAAVSSLSNSPVKLVDSSRYKYAINF